MFKKLLLLTFLLFSTGLHAFTLVQNDSAESISIKVDPKFNNLKRTDWIAIYKKEASTDWDNVIEWKWATEVAFDSIYYSDILATGDYVIRYFKDNSFTISDEYEFHIDVNEKLNIFSIDRKYLNGNASLRISYHNIVGDKDWIGFYKKNSSTAWENVIKWHWVKDLKCSNPDDCHDSLPVEDLAPGDYEVRYFKNNSFTIHSQPINLNIIKVNSTLSSIDAFVDNKNIIKMSFNGVGTSLPANPKDWIALYEVNDSNAWENVVQWVWAKDIELGRATAYHSMKNIKRGWYEVRYFLNNSFSTYAKSKVIFVK